MVSTVICKSLAEFDSTAISMFACYFGRYYKVKCDWLIRANITEINLLLRFKDNVFIRTKLQSS